MSEKFFYYKDQDIFVQDDMNTEQSYTKEQLELLSRYYLLCVMGSTVIKKS